jgi:hypothetical protein
MIPTRTTTNASERERQLAQARDDAQATAEAQYEEHQKAGDRWSAAVRARQALWRRTYTPAQAEARSRAEAHERAAYDALRQAAQDTDAALAIRNDAIDAHERHAYPPDDRTPPAYAISYADRANRIHATTNTQ